MLAYQQPSVDQQEQVLGGFRLLSALGHGSFATAYLAQQIGTERKAVVKVAHPHMVAGHHGEVIRQRFDAEVRAITRIQHPNMVTVYTSGLTPDAVPYIAMEFVQGRTLDAVLQQSAPLPFAMTHAIFEQVASVLKSAHALGVVHRDITPNNIMLQDSPTGEPIARVLDFGLAMLDGKHSHTVGPIGTPRYLAPEQLNGQPTTRSDIFSLGAVLWWALTGREYLEEASSIFDIFRIYNSNKAPLDPRTIAPHISPEIAALVASLLQPDPISRPDAVTFLQRWAALAPQPSSRVYTSVKDFSRRPASSGEWVRPGSQPRTAAPRVTTYTGLSLGDETSSAVIAPSLPRQAQHLQGVSILHVCAEHHMRVKIETHLEQHGALVSVVSRFNELLVELVQQQPDVVLLDSLSILSHIPTIQQITRGMPTPPLLVALGEQRPPSLPPNIPFVARAEVLTQLTNLLREGLNSPHRRQLSELQAMGVFNIGVISSLMHAPEELDSRLVNFIGDTPELIAQMEESLAMRDLALTHGITNQLYNNASQLGLESLSHTIAEFSTLLQPHRVAQAEPLLAHIEYEYMAAFPAILKLRALLQTLR
jgi:tRNA A-37 threonylcarbamoyl transferase component Bud32